jgi:1-acyl-sn-glycerol-3-phosphate acyltransferase
VPVGGTDEDTSPEQAQQEPPIPALLVSLFRRYGERHLGRQFHALRLSKSQRPDLVAARGKPLIVYFNQSSWWDPLVCLQLAGQLFPDRRHYGPIDAGAPGRVRFFGRMGFFAVEPGTPNGARRFLATSQEILARPDAALWVPAGEGFTDPRQRPLELRSGIGHLASRIRPAVLLPLALNYSFWEDRLPEALGRFGEEILTGDADLRASDWTTVLEERLDSALDALAAESLARDPARFDVLLGGAAGEEAEAPGVWRRLKGVLGGG